VRRTAVAAAGVGAAGLGVALWWRRNPSACPYNQRFWVQAPHPLITRDRLRTVGANVLGVVVNGVVTPSYRAVPPRVPAVAAGQLAGAGLPA